MNSPVSEETNSILTTKEYKPLSLPNKPLDTILMAPLEWSKQEHSHCKHIDTHKNRSSKKPSCVTAASDTGVKHEDIKRNGVISELDQWRRNKNSTCS